MLVGVFRGSKERRKGPEFMVVLWSNKVDTVDGSEIPNNHRLDI